MAILDNAKRNLLQAVYTPVKINEEKRRTPARRGWVKWGMIAALRPTHTEVTKTRRHFSSARIENIDLAEVGRLLDGIEAWLLAPGGTDFAVVVPGIATISQETLTIVGDYIVELRKQEATTGLNAMKTVLTAYRETMAAPATPAVETPPAGYIAVDDAGISGARLYVREEGTSPTAPTTPPVAGAGAGRDEETADGGSLSQATIMLRTSTPTSGAPAPAAASTASLSIQALYDWAIRSNTAVTAAQGMYAAAEAFGMNPPGTPAAKYNQGLQAQLDKGVNIVAAFKKQMEVEPIGLLHLERVTFAPDGIERGELVYSVPLAPGERVNIAHKEWSNTSEEFEQIVSDYMENYSEEGVAEKSEMAQSTNSQQQHSNGFNTGVTASGGYGPVSITTTLGVNVASSATESQQFSRNQSIAVTRKASARSKKEHKMSFKVASASGTEDQTVRLIRNPFLDKATRVDYYQLLRKWEVNAYRYGIRLTYDLTIPEPGSDILSKIKEINDLSDVLQKGFGSSDGTIPWAYFDLKPSDITRNNYMTHAAEYNADAPKPPAEFKWFDVSMQHQWKTADDAERSQFFTLEIDVDEEYAVDQVNRDRNFTKYIGKNWYFGWQSVNDFFGKSGKRIMVYQAYYLGSLYVELRVRAALREDAYNEWKLKAWNAIRDAAQARYYEQRQLVKDRLSKLMDDLGAQDALTLRKIEREEVMKGVLRWLFGPEFTFTPPGMPADLYAANESIINEQLWGTVMMHGELIKFLHQAIEWENVLYFLYPYFWSHISRWEMKKYLDHPDAMHKAFLKSGSARVVLTIRPGFERDFVALMDSGLTDWLPSDDAYMTIIDEMEAYANTNYPGIPPANPEEANKNEQGVLIGTWHEYTPTSAIDISFNETMPTA